MKIMLSQYSGARVVRDGAVVLAAAAILGGCAAVDGETLATDDPSGSVEPAANDEAVRSSSEELTGTTCLASANDDFAACRDVIYWDCYFSFSGSGVSGFAQYCMDQATSACNPSYTAAKTACAFGLNRIYRVNDGFHHETKVYSGGTVELKFDLWPKPYGAGADPNPIYRCAMDTFQAGYRDFPSKDPNCDGKGSAARISILGYSVPSTFSGTKKAKALYRCRTGSDHFISTASNCEGKVNEGLLGYGLF